MVARVPAQPARSRHLPLSFDFEGVYGMPHDAPYDTVSAAHRILDRLSAYGASAVSMERLGDELAEADVAVTCTSAAGFVVRREDVRDRKGRPLFLIDLAVPRDVDPALNDVDGPGRMPDPVFAAERPGEVKRSCLDPTRARLDLGWEASVSLPDGLRRVLATL